MLFFREPDEPCMLRNMEKNWLPGLLVAVVAFVVYANSLGNGFAMDDNGVILNNPVFQGSPWSLFTTMDTVSDVVPIPYYRPLTYLSFMMEERLHGFNPFLVRLLNVLLHSGNAFLVYLLARTLLNNTNAALLAGLFFAVHPLHTEGVDFNAGGRNTLLACFFVLSAYLIHRRSVIRNGLLGAFGGACMFLGGLFSKEMALMALPFILLLEREQILQGTKTLRLRAGMRLLPYAGATLLYLALRQLTLAASGVQSGLIPGTGDQVSASLYIMPDLGSRLLSNLYIIPRYFLTVIYPVALSSVYEVPEDLHLLALPLTAAWLCIILVFSWIFLRGRSHATLFGLGWSFFFWLPVSGIVWFASSPLADRYIYIPAIGFWIIVADQASRHFPTGKSGRIALGAAAVVLLVLALLTIKRNRDWKDDIALFSRVTVQYPDNPYGHAYLGDAYFLKQGERNLKMAEQEFEKALDLQPMIYKDGREIPPLYSLMVNDKLGHIRVARGDYEGALHYYSRALSIYPLDREALLNRGMTLDRLGRSDEAITDYQRFLRAPGSAFSDRQHYAEGRVRELSR